MIRRWVCWWFGHRTIDWLMLGTEPIAGACVKCGHVLSHNEAEHIWAGQL
jgi:hypothetical protein